MLSQFQSSHKFMHYNIILFKITLIKEKFVSHCLFPVTEDIEKLMIEKKQLDNAFMLDLYGMICSNYRFFFKTTNPSRNVIEPVLKKMVKVYGESITLEIVIFIYHIFYKYKGRYIWENQKKAFPIKMCRQQENSTIKWKFLQCWHIQWKTTKDFEDKNKRASCDIG